jgi:hypothetical protein
MDVELTFGQHRDLTLMEGDHLLSIAEDDRQRLVEASTAIGGHPYDDVEEFQLQAALASQELPKSIRRRLLTFRRAGNREGALLIRGLPVDPELPATPLDSRRSADKTTYVSETWLSVFASALGEPVGYLQEKEGSLFQDTCPTPHNANLFSSESSAILLPFHTELAFHPFLPSFVLLYCLRPDMDRIARTLIGSIRNVRLHLADAQESTLRQPIFETGIDYSFGRPNATRGGGLVCPVLYGRPEDPYLRFDPDLMQAQTSDGQTTLNDLNALASAAAGAISLEAGDLLVIDNRRAAHARTPFRARFDGTDRWLQRTFVVDSLADSAADREIGSRIIRTEFVV